MTLKIAAVSFLNTVPLIEWFVDHPSTDYELISELPSRLASKLENGEADIALLPVAELLRGRAAGFFPGTGIACRGAVDSVKLFYKGELSDIKLIWADRGSRTSIALLQVLLADLFGRRPEVREVVPVAGMMPELGEGILIIGDRCFEYERALKFTGPGEIQAVDLGTAWFEMTGLPFVFAVWSASHRLLDNINSSELENIAQRLNQARDYGWSRLAEIAKRESTTGRNEYAKQADSETLLYYFEHSLRYTIGKPEMDGLAMFHQLCVKHGVVPDGPPPAIL